jgi:hypothetical protein
MPETRLERVFFLAGLIAIALLAALVVWERGSRDPPTRRAAAVVGAQTRPTGPTTRTSTTSALPAGTGTTTREQPTDAPALTRLRLTARSDTWMTVHQTSRTGPVLFEGTLGGGETRTFAGVSFSVRFGAAANVDATLNGRPLPLPGGTYTVEIDSTGLGARSA